MSKLSVLKFMKAIALLLLCVKVSSQGITVPRTPSPAASVSQTIGISTVSVAYSRPSVKGREVWGNLVPYGWNVQAFGAHHEAPWRAGANENTVISFSHDAKVEGHPVPAGSYGLFFVINKDNSGELVLSRDSRSWGSFWYDAKQDFLRARISLRNIEPVELLTYDFLNTTKTSAELVLNWEKKQFPVKIEFDVDKIVIANAETELKGPAGFNWQGYAAAANYALQNQVELDKALGWIDLAIAQSRTYTTLSTKAGILTGLNKKAGADSILEDAIAIATENELNQYGYQLINQGQKEKAIEILLLNTRKNPKSANAWDSLGEAYALNGDKKNAITNFKKSLTLHPPVNTRLNSEKYLKQLGAL